MGELSTLLAFAAVFLFQILIYLKVRSLGVDLGAVMSSTWRTALQQQEHIEISRRTKDETVARIEELRDRIERVVPR